VKDKHCYKDGSVLHREDGPAVEDASGNKWWYINGELHKEHGPAIEYADGGKVWWINNKLHRVDGPAIEYADGDKVWYIDGNVLTEEEFDNHPKVQNYRFQVLLEEVLSER